MTSNFALASQCQLKRDEVHALLVLAASVEKQSANDSDPPPLWRQLLTAAHVRSLMVRALVRASIPRSRQQLLLRENKYAQANSTGDGRSAYRVGRIVALLPRPGAADKPSTAHAEKDTGAEHSALLSDWLVAIHFGEATELFAAKFLSNESITEDEHAVYVRSCIAARRPVPPELMPAEEADAVARNVKDIRQYVVESTAGGGAAARKRQRDEGTGAAGRKENKEEEEEEEEEEDLSREDLLAERARHRAERRQWDTQRAEQQRHLVALRQMLNGKSGEAQRALQAQRQAEAAQRTALEQWRAKAEEQGNAIRRAEAELAAERDARREHSEKTDRLVAQLKRLAEQTRRFKDVSDAAAEWMGVGSRQPEEVLARLRQRIAGDKA